VLDLLKKYYIQILTVTILIIILILLGWLYIANRDFGNKDNDSSDIATDGEEIILTYYRWQDDGGALKEIAELYQNEHPNITIVIRYINEFDQSLRIDPKYDYRDYIIEQIADGTAPDIFSIRNEWLPYMVNQIYPLPDKMMSLAEYENEFAQVVIDDFVVGRKIYALPFFMDNLILFYNPQIMQQAGWFKPPATWQDVKNIAPSLTKTYDNGDLVQSAINLGLDYNSIPRFAEIIAALIMQYGGEMVSFDREKIAFNLPAPEPKLFFCPGVEAVKLYTSFADRQSANFTYTNDKNLDGSRKFPSDVQAFGEKKMAMLIHYGYMGLFFNKFYPNLDFKVAPLPQIRLSSPVTISKYWGETVSKYSEYPEIAWDFINFAVQKKQLKYMAKATNRIPSRRSLWVDYIDDFYKPIVHQAEYSKSWYRVNPEKAVEVFADMVNNVLYFGVAPEIAIQTAARDM